jgi:DNA-binding NarL/FixJ family response regulator
VLEELRRQLPRNSDKQQSKLVMSKKSKKCRIVELMDKGKPAKEIASMLNTAESYINKVEH